LTCEGDGTRFASLHAWRGRLSRFGTATATRFMAESGRSSGTALVPVERACARDIVPRYAQRPQASFVVQLIATERRMAQTRLRRRVDPREASAAYRARLTRRITPGRVLSVSA
jgi:hypothetical protein